jgi:hypothetical protein
MWPSMQPPGSPKPKAPPKPDIVSKPSLEDPGLLENIEWTQFPTDEFHAEKIALERWLSSDDPGPTNAPVKPTTPTVTSDSSSNGQPHNLAGFDDDFTDFVSAPAPAPATTGITPKGLASDVVHEKASGQARNDPEDDLFSDDFLPTDQEILMTSHRIFGPVLPSQRGSSSASTRAAQADSDHEEKGEDEDHTARNVDFDLSRIMGVLQGLKEEISGIEEEEAKRRMAARVAMGLLYGLEG